MGDKFQDQFSMLLLDIWLKISMASCWFACCFICSDMVELMATKFVSHVSEIDLLCVYQ